MDGQTNGFPILLSLFFYPFLLISFSSLVLGLPIHSRQLIGWEEKYRKCHLFLAKTLQSMTKKRKVPHLEGLAVALLYSCPA